MTTHLFMGAINKLSNEREAPLFADKKNSYICPDCNKDVIFKKGKIKKAHFAHKASEVKCTFYDKPSETQIHKEAKILMKSLLDNMKELHFYRKCSDCNTHKNIDIHYNDNMKAIIEYKFNYNDSNRSADVALVEDNNIKYIFEICYKNKTKECNRPEPWVEIDAEELIKNINENNDYNIECIREYICDGCILAEQERVLKIKQLQEHIEKERLLKLKQLQEQIEKEKLLKLKQDEINRQNSLLREKRQIEINKALEEEKIRRKKDHEYYESELKKRSICRIKDQQTTETNIYNLYKLVIDNIFINKSMEYDNSNKDLINNNNQCFYCNKNNINMYFDCVKHVRLNFFNENNSYYKCKLCKSNAIKHNYIKNYSIGCGYCDGGCKTCVLYNKQKNDVISYCCSSFTCLSCSNTVIYDYNIGKTINYDFFNILLKNPINILSSS